MEYEYGQVAAALAKAQSEFKDIKMDKIGKAFHKTRDGSFHTTEYPYGSLQAILKATVPALNKYGLFINQVLQTEGCRVSCTTIIYHESNMIASAPFTLISKDDKPQSIGSAATYARRYSLASMLGVFAEEDDDGERAQPKLEEKKPFQKEPNELDDNYQNKNGFINNEELNILKFQIDNFLGGDFNRFVSWYKRVKKSDWKNIKKDSLQKILDYIQDNSDKIK